VTEECQDCQRLEKELAEWKELAQHWRRKFGESERARMTNKQRSGG
jgi:predicted Fe-S protein YdhL (DUF1289 family)